MKRYIFVILAILSFHVSAQDGWTKIHPNSTLKNLMDVHFNNDYEGWAVGVDGLIMHTADGGYTWETQHSNDDESFWSVFFIDEQEGWVCGWSAVYYTDDAGQNWTKQSTPACMGDFTDVFFINADTGWVVGTYEIVLKTTNGGNDWVKIQNSVYNGMCFYAVDFVDEMRGCAVGGHHYGQSGFIMISSDGGFSWTETTPDTCECLSAVDYLPSSPIWACGRDGFVIKSIDGGQTWADTYDASFDSFDDIHFFNEQNGIMIDGHESFMTFDAGSSWDSTAYITYYNSMRKLMSWEENKVFAVGNNGGMSRSLDGGTSWENMSDNISACMYNIGFSNISDGFAISNSTPYGRFLRTNSGGHSWYFDTSFVLNAVYDCWVNGEEVRLLSTTSEMFVSHNSGQHWDTISIPEIGSKYQDIQFVNENTGFLCAGEGILYKTEDGGNHWINQSLDTSFYLLEMFFVDENLGFLIDWDNKQILRTQDGGYQWDASNLINNIQCHPVSICFSGTNVGFVSTSEGCIFKTTDGGENWNPHYTWPQGSIFSKIVFINEMEGWYLNSSVYHTTDGGSTWSEGVGFEDESGICIYFLDENNGWFGGGNCLVAKYDGTVSMDEPTAQHQSFFLYPNPASNMLNLLLDSPCKERVEVSIFDMQGKQREHIYIQKGENRVSIKLSDHSPGTYLISLVNENTRYTKKFIIK